MKVLFRTAFIVIATASLACGRGNAADPAKRLESAGTEAARFLAGYGRFDKLDLADTVDLYVAPDGGGARARMPRDLLRDREAWQVESGGQKRSFVPTGLRTRLVSAVGKYMNCNPSELKTRFPQLASYPHVGVKLEPANAKSCLESWNVTFVYDTAGGRTRLTAAIYDQWEW